jgi:peptidoglycan hydrolase-like protein with peptidoglycan-binding domain
MADGEDIVHSITDGGIAAKHPSSPAFQILVAPSTGAEKNTTRLRLVAIACWRMDDIRFDFDSSFVLPDAADEMALLSELVKVHTHEDALKNRTPPPISIFGHADPVGSDEYNKFLSGRRAAAVYGMLTRRHEVWEDLFSNTGTFTTPVAGDQWGMRSLQIILRELAVPVTVTGARDNQMQEAVRTFQANRGLAPDGSPGPLTRRELFLSYMDKICVDRNGTPFQIDKQTGFLARNQDSGGKGDYQGCGEFNPLLLFSQQDDARFQQATDKAERNTANQPNRRVVALLFRPDSRIVSMKWPCPRAREGPMGCRRRFFFDGEARRNTRFPSQPRKFEETKDTFACRFYQRLTTGSPCERVLRTFEIRLYDPRGQFISQAPFEFTVGQRAPVAGKANDNGILILRDIEVPARCHVRWGFKPEDVGEPNLVFDLDMFLTITSESREKEATEKLHNLGYADEDELADKVTSFQRDYGHLNDPPLDVDGILSDDTMELIRNVYRSCEDDLRKIRPEKVE